VPGRRLAGAVPGGAAVGAGGAGGAGVRIIRIGIHARTTPPTVIP